MRSRSAVATRRPCVHPVRNPHAPRAEELIVEFVLLLAAVAGLLWLGLVVLRGGLIGTALLVLLAGTCFGHPFFNVSA